VPFYITSGVAWDKSTGSPPNICAKIDRVEMDNSRGVTGRPDDPHILVDPADAVPKIPVPSNVDKGPDRTTTSQRRICGLAPLVFWSLLGLVAVVIAAAIGGGVGGSLSVKNCRDQLHLLQVGASSMAAGTPSASTQRPAAPSATPIPSTGCPDSAGKTYESKAGFSFTRRCSTDWIGDNMAASVTTSWELCMEACGSINYYSNLNNQTRCFGVKYVPSWIVKNYSVGNISFEGNCFMKNSLAGRLPANRNPYEIVSSQLNS